MHDKRVDFGGIEKQQVAGYVSGLRRCCWRSSAAFGTPIPAEHGDIEDLSPLIYAGRRPDSGSDAWVAGIGSETVVVELLAVSYTIDVYVLTNAEEGPTRRGF